MFDPVDLTVATDFNSAQKFAMATLIVVRGSDLPVSGATSVRRWP